MEKFDVKAIAKIAVFLGLIVMLEVLESLFLRMPQGGSLSLATLLFLFVIPVLTNRDSLVLFILWRLLAIILIPPFIASPLQFLLDYIIAYSGFLGVIILLKPRKHTRLILAIILANSWRYFIHVLTGILYFGQYAEGPIVAYSLLYNLTYMLPTLVIHIILAIIMKKNWEKIQ
ncbi:MAG: energy-coupled thiamine transporter ThiT [Culicoidibacterales bacterium]